MSGGAYRYAAVMRCHHQMGLDSIVQGSSGEDLMHLDIHLFKRHRQAEDRKSEIAK